MESVSKQVMRVNEAFRKRITDTRVAKETLEHLQKDTLQKLKDIATNIVELKTEIVAKEKYIQLCQNRLVNRAQRPGPELCNDRVQHALAVELQTLQQTVTHLKRMIAEVIIPTSSFIWLIVRLITISISVNGHQTIFATHKNDPGRRSGQKN